MTPRGSSARTPDDFVERLRDVVTANVEGSAKLVTRFGAFVRVASRELRDTRPGERRDAEAALMRWLEFNLASFSAVSVQGLALFNDLLSAAESTLVSTEPRAPDVGSRSGSRVELGVSGRHGERATTGFVIENNFDRLLEVTFSPTDPSSGSVRKLPAGLVTFEPNELEIGPGGTGVVRVSVQVADDLEVGETYSTTVRLLGFEGKEVGISLTVLSPDGAGAESESSTKKRKPAGTKRKPAKRSPEPDKAGQKRKPRTRK